MYKKEKLGLLFLLAFFVFFFLVTGTVHKDARMYPYIVCILGIALTSIQMGMTISKERRGETLNGEEAMTKHSRTILSLHLLPPFCMFLWQVYSDFSPRPSFMLFYSPTGIPTHRKSGCMWR